MWKEIYKFCLFVCFKFWTNWTLFCHFYVFSNNKDKTTGSRSDYHIKTNNVQEKQPTSKFMLHISVFMYLYTLRITRCFLVALSTDVRRFHDFITLWKLKERVVAVRRWFEVFASKREWYVIYSITLMVNKTPSFSCSNSLSDKNPSLFSTNSLDQTKLHPTNAGFRNSTSNQPSVLVHFVSKPMISNQKYLYNWF